MSTISDLLSALRTAPSETAHDLGYALPGLDDGSLRELRNELAAIESDDPAVSTAAAVLVDVVDGYRVARRERVTFALPEGMNRAVLCQLEQGPATTSDLARTLRRSEPQVSRAISRLRQLDLIDPPHRSAVDGRVVEHRLSITAQQALARVDDVERRQPVWMLSGFDAVTDQPVRIEDEPARPFAVAAAVPVARPQPMPRTSRVPISTAPGLAAPSPAAAKERRKLRESTGPIAVPNVSAFHKKDD